MPLRARQFPSYAATYGDSASSHGRPWTPVAQAGFEPATYGVCSHRSTKLSYSAATVQKTGGCCAWPGSPSHQPPDFYAVFRGTYPTKSAPIFIEGSPLTF